MIDVVDRATRSRMMAGIRGRDTRPELALRRALHREGFRFRLHVQGLSGTPDIVLARHRVALYVHGCFWHHHAGCRYATTPSTRPDFWAAKFIANAERDRRDVSQLLDKGWRVGIVWECTLKGGHWARTVAELTSWILARDSGPFREFSSQLNTVDYLAPDH